MMIMERPTIGRIVRYLKIGDTGIERVAAIVTHVHEDGSVNLQAFHDRPGGVTWYSNVTCDPDVAESGTWHWPPRE